MTTTQDVIDSPFASFEGRLLRTVGELRIAAEAAEARHLGSLAHVHPTQEFGAKNLLHYLSLRSNDLRDLQRQLASLGLSSLGRMEKCVLPTLRSVEYALRRLDGRSAEEQPEPIQHGAQEGVLEEHTRALLGPGRPHRRTRIMVTLALDATASDVRRLLDSGMDVARINCSKGGVEDWERLTTILRESSVASDRPCPILCDLAGPNPRTRLFRRDREAPPRLLEGSRFALVANKAARDVARQRYAGVAVIGCSMPEILPHLQVGDPVSYDDGRLVGKVCEAGSEVCLVEVTSQAKPEIKLRDQKGLNFPASKLPFPSLTEKDLADLDFVVRHGDLVGFSFVRSPEDVICIQEELRKRSAERLGLLLKIETTAAFNDLGRLLLTAMRSERVGLMVARGDMAVELGFERLAEAQEEVLWLGEAALVPVVWATQVLENLSKKGVPSRAEVTDAAMSGRAECVMLNRGDHVNRAVCFLDDVLTRMQGHQEKKRSMLRRLRISEVPGGTSVD